MPTLIIQTNVETPADQRRELLQNATTTIAKALGKPESYVMVILKHNQDMLFAGAPSPLAYLELKSLELPEKQVPDLSATLCGFMETRFGVDPGRVYIEFASPPRHMFGWNGGTF